MGKKGLRPVRAVCDTNVVVAIGANADWLITGDPDLLTLSGQTRLRILEPSRALDSLGHKTRAKSQDMI